MKKVFKVFAAIALLFAFSLPVFSQPSANSSESYVIDNFDTEKDWKWTVTASRFIAEGFPKYGYFKGIPNSLKPFQSEDTEAKVLGVQTSYLRKGDNWFEVFPTIDGKNYEVPFIGYAKQIDFWVWGAGYNYYLEVLVRDANGMVHVLPAGSLAFSGWKNLIVRIPGWMTQRSKLRSGPKSLSFIGFRVRSDSAEYVDDFVVYFDQLRYITNPLTYIYDGFELLENDFSDAETGNNAGVSNSEAK